MRESGIQALVDALSEFGLIARYFRPLAGHSGALALGDDACVLPEEAGRDLVVTADAMIGGVHFIADAPPHLIAAKALRTNLSDLAAKGAVPVGYLLSLALPRSTDDAWLADFAKGLGDDQVEFGVSLLGGDTTATDGPLMIAITAMGRLPSGTMIRRAGARPGDHVFVSGTIGDAGAGLAVLQASAQVSAEEAATLVGRYWHPTPRLALGQALRGIASASLDVSDGLVADLGHIAEQSGVRIVLDAERVPLSSSLRAAWPGEAGVLRAITAGDDYEVAFTAPSLEAVQATAGACGVPVTRIGVVDAGEGVAVLGQNGREVAISCGGYTHF